MTQNTTIYKLIHRDGDVLAMIKVTNGSLELCEAHSAYKDRLLYHISNGINYPKSYVLSKFNVSATDEKNTIAEKLFGLYEVLFNLSVVKSYENRVI